MDERDMRSGPTREPERPPDDDVDRSSENVLDGWPRPLLDDPPLASPDELPHSEPEGEPARVATAPLLDEASADQGEHSWSDEESEASDVAWGSAPATDVPGSETEPSESTDSVTAVESGPGLSEHAPGELLVPPGVPVLEGGVRGERRAVGIVVSRFNGEVTSQLLASALDELELRGVEQGSITVMPVPGAFELPIAAMALAKTRRFACVVALGCVIRGDTAHFDYVASEAASGLQLAAIETGVPVAFGLLTLDRPDQAEPRYAKGAEAVRTALEMADLFANLRAAASR